MKTPPQAAVGAKSLRSGCWLGSPRWIESGKAVVVATESGLRCGETLRVLRVSSGASGGQSYATRSVVGCPCGMWEVGLLDGWGLQQFIYK